MVFLVFPAERMGVGTERMGPLSVGEPFHMVHVMVAAGREPDTTKWDPLVFMMGRLENFILVV